MLLIERSPPYHGGGGGGGGHGLRATVSVSREVLGLRDFGWLGAGIYYCRSHCYWYGGGVTALRTIVSVYGGF